MGDSKGQTADTSQLFFIMMGWLLMLCFLFMFHRLQRMVHRLLQLGGCKKQAMNFWRSEQQGAFKDMQHVLLRLHQAKSSQGMLSTAQVQKEVEDWKLTNSPRAKAHRKGSQRSSRNTVSPSGSPKQATAALLRKVSAPLTKATAVVLRKATGGGVSDHQKSPEDDSMSDVLQVGTACVAICFICLLVTDAFLPSVRQHNKLHGKTEAC
jgi:hypothetical protein